jgi:LPXTG-site transpeptidase (sortase) family protein
LLILRYFLDVRRNIARVSGRLIVAVLASLMATSVLIAEENSFDPAFHARHPVLANHPNITAVHDLGTHDGAPYIVTELLEGETLRARISGGALPSRLIIPTLGLDVPIKEVFIVDDQWEIAKYAAGYLNGSGLPGVPGNLAMSGHAGLYGAVFASLGSLNPGADIYVDAAGVRYRYRLRTASTVWPNQVEVLDTTETPTMTLITCTNWDTQRLVAQADFVDSSPLLDA